MILSSWNCYSNILNTHRIQMIQNNERRIGCPLPSMGEKEKNMKISINADIEMEFAEVMAACLESAAKKKVSDEVKIQAKDTFGTTQLEDLNKSLKDLENNKEHLEKLTWPQICFHKHMLLKLLSNKIISFDEYYKRWAIIVDAWYSQSMGGLEIK